MEVVVKQRHFSQRSSRDHSQGHRFGDREGKSIKHISCFPFFVLYIFSFSYIFCNFIFNGYGIPNGKDI